MNSTIFENTNFIRVIKVLGACVALVYVSLAIYVSAGRYFSSHISQYEQPLIELLNQRTGLSWQIEHLNIEWRGINPVVSAQNLRALQPNPSSQLNDKPRNPAIKVDRFSAYIDVFASVINRQPRLYGLNATHVSLLLEKQSDNRITLAGMPHNKQAGGSFDLTGFVDHLRYLSVPELSVAFQLPVSQNADNIALPLLAARISGDTNQRVIRLKEHSEKAKAPAIASTRFDLKIVSQLKYFDFASRFTGSSAHSERLLAPLLKVFARNWAIEKLRADFWFSKEYKSYRVVAPTLSGKISRNKESYRFEGDIDLASNTRLAQLSWKNMFVAYNDIEAQIPNGAVQTSLANSQVKSLLFSADALGLTPVIKLVDDFDLLPEKVTQILTTLKPSGTLRNIIFELPMRSPEKFQLQATMDGVAIAPWKGAPGASGLSGKIIASLAEGFVTLDSTNEFSLLFERLYRKPLTFSAARGTVNWRVADKRYYVWGDNLLLNSATDSAEYGGQFAINGRTNKEGESSHLLLNIGVRDAQAADLLAYIPYNAPAQLINWAGQSRLSGSVSEGAFIYNGSLEKGRPELRSINAFFQLDDAALSYYTGWPLTEALSGSVMVNNALVKVAIDESELSGLTISNAKVEVKAGGTDPYAKLSAKANGEVDALLAFLKQMPTGGALLGQITDWRGNGTLSDVPLQMVIPLSSSSNQKLLINATAQLENAQLIMPNYGIDIEQINGSIGFSETKGLYADNLQASIWQKPVAVRLGDFSDLDVSSGLNSLRVQADATVDMRSLSAWLKQPVLDFGRGKTDVSLDIRSLNGKTKLQVKSELAGITIAAPGALAKTSDAIANLDLLWNLSEPMQPMTLQIDQRVAGVLHFDQGKMQGGYLRLGEQGANEAPNIIGAMNSDKALTLSGALADLNLSVVQQAIADYQQYDDRYAKIKTESKARQGQKKEGQKNSATPPTPLRIVDLRINHLLAFDQSFDNTIINAQHDEQRWIFEIESDQLGGTIKLPSTIDDPVDMLAANPPTGKLATAYSNMPALAENVTDENRYVFNLDYLRISNINKPLDSDNTSARVDSFSTRWDIPDLAVDIAQLYSGEKALGRWHFLYTGGEKAALIHDINIDYASMLLASDVDEGLLWAVNDGDVVTALDISFRSDNPKHFFTAILGDEQALPLISKRFDGAISLSWEGAPEAIQFNKLNGNIDFAFDEGRFINSPSSATGALKVLGLLNFDNLLRRINFDFSDVYQEGLRFDDMSGELDFNDHSVSFDKNPINVSAPGSNFTLVGDLNLDSQIIDAELIVTLPVANNLPWIAALAGGLPVAAGAYVVTKVLNKPLNKLSSAVYRVDGSLSDPKLRFDRLFDDASKRKEK